MILGTIIGSKNSELKINYTFLEIISLIIAAISMWLVCRGSIPSYLAMTAAWIIPISIILLTFVFEKGIISKLLSSKVFIWLGNISLEAFLIHSLIIRYTARFTRNIGSNWAKYLVLIVMLGVTILLSYATNKVLNRKMIKKSVQKKEN